MVSTNILLGANSLELTHTHAKTILCVRTYHGVYACADHRQSFCATLTANLISSQREATGWKLAGTSH